MRRAGTAGVLILVVFATSGQAVAAPAPDRAFRTPVYHSRAARSTASISRSSLCDQLASRLHQGGAYSGLFVENARAGNVICRSAASTQRSLASNTKLFTTSTAMSRFGPGYRFETQIWRVGSVDSAGTLHGDLYLVGGGDPTLSDPGFDSRYMGGIGSNLLDLARQVKAAGITKVTGMLIGDDTIFDSLRGVADSNYATSSYIGPLSGLDYNMGYAGSSTSSGFADDPARAATLALDAELRKDGIELPGHIGLQKLPAGGARAKLGSVSSPELDRIVDQTDTYSINFYAEMLEKDIGAGFGGAGTTAAGAQQVQRFARSNGSGIHAVDGSGLTRSNRASPAQVGNLLAAVRGSSIGSTFADDLPLAGREGTVADRMRGTAADGRCRTKTGTLTGVSALSGYCFNRSGKVMIFSILMNGVGSIDNAHAQQDKMAALIARY
jgi:D-alanyl-D-alanine carboxypeptidase/D-alanyl-D-alanine-endopeptidase (penicillin-binding protein 4)